MVDPLDFFARLAQQVPPAGTHLILYYACYSTRRRALPRLARMSNGQAARRGEALASTAASAEEQTPSAKARRGRWAQLLRLVFEVDPLVYPACGGAMRLHLYAPDECCARDEVYPD